MAVVNTSKIIQEFSTQVDTNNEYTLNELRDILTNIYKTFNNKKVKKNGEKRAPTKYNIFVQNKIKEIRQEDSNISAKEAMSKAAGMWKNMTTDQKNNYV